MPTLSGAVVSGAYGRGFASDTDEEAFIIGIHFKPGGAFPFLGLPPGELANKHVELKMFWGRSAVHLRERLCEAKTSAERFRLLQESLLDHLSLRKEHHYSVAAALDMFQCTKTVDPVREIAQHVGLSQRRFIQVFKAEVGMTPKLFSRIQRFQRTRAFIESCEAINWVNAALSFGYFDQSHLIREFLEFSGRSPMKYLSQRKFIARKRNSHQIQSHSLRLVQVNFIQYRFCIRCHSVCRGGKIDGRKNRGS